LTALWAKTADGLDDEGRARSVFRKYLWRAFFSNRYEKSTNSRALADYVELCELLAGNKVSPAVLDRQLHPLPETDELILAGWPTKKERLARAILALALREGGNDLADGSTVTRANLRKREYHHLFPDAHLTKKQIDRGEIYRSLNCALITWKTNRNISSKEPEKYLAERLDGTGVDEKEIRERLSKHIIPYDEMIAGDYQRFLRKRAEMIQAKMLEICGEDAKA
jgi:hypothetical protein